ncbi:MAG: amidase [Proteobacteria bacterium]|nr:amidase [Pseudomonadota bacterium]
MTEIWQWPALEIAETIARREVTSEEVVRLFYERIERVNPKIGAYVTLCPEEALEAARAVDQRIAGGETPPNPLFGVPTSIKDLIETRGVRTTHGSTFFRDYVPPADAVLVERLKAAGCPILGKTNTPEFGGKFTTDNQLFPTTRNPWNPERTPGGSSGGAAAQIASGMGPLAVGNDGGGSIRVPAHCSGVFGLKPHFGRVPSWPRYDAWTTLAHEGPITRTVRDAAAMLDIMAGPDDRDRKSLPAAGLNYLAACEGDLEGLTVAWSPTLGYGRVENEVREICGKAARAFEAFGCRVEEDCPDLPCPEPTYLAVLSSRLAPWLEDMLPEGFREHLDPMVGVLLPGVDQMTARDAIRADFGVEQVWDVFRPFFARYNLFLVPTMAAPAWNLEYFSPNEINGEPLASVLEPFFTFPFNLTGQPAASIPAGFTRDGLPVGLQIVGRRFEEDLVLRAAACFEAVRPWADRWPEVAFS